MNNYYLGFQDGHLHLQAHANGSFAILRLRIQDQELEAFLVSLAWAAQEPGWRGKVQIRTHSRDSAPPLHSASLAGADREVVATFLATLILEWIRSMLKDSEGS